MSKFEFFLRDPTSKIKAQVDDVEEFQTRLRFNDVSSWVISAPFDSQLVQATQPGWGIQVLRDGAPLVSGPMTQRARSLDEQANKLTVSGVDDTTWLAWRLAMPSPAQAAPPYSNAYDVRTGVGSTVLMAYANANAGPGAILPRRVAGLVMGTDLALGSVITGRARYQTVLEFLQGLAIQAGGLGFRIIQNTTTGNLEFDVYQPQNLAAEIVFDLALGNLGGFGYTGTSPQANYAVAGGKGEETTRPIREGSDAGSVASWGRIETFVDKRDSTDNAEIDAAITQKLTQLGEQTTMAVQPIETERQRFGFDYNLGDRVTAVVDGALVADVLTEVNLSVNADGETLQPTVGAPSRLGIRTLFDSLRRMDQRLGDLERI